MNRIDPNDFPGMIGYIVQPGDNLWSIAKKYRMSIERIREVNQDNTKTDSLNATASGIQKEGKSPEELGTKPMDKTFAGAIKRIVIGNIRIMIG